MSLRTTAITVLTVAAPLFLGCRAWEPPIQGSGTIQQEVRSLEKFDTVSVAGGGVIILESSSESSECTIECDDNLLEFIQTEVRDGELVIHPTRNISPTKETALKIKTGNLKKLSLAGSWRTTVSGVDEPEFGLEVAGSGEVIAQGTTKSLKAELAGSGKFDLLDLPAEKVEVDIAGSASAKVNATKNLKVDIAGSASVQYTGDPKVEKSIAGVGSVKQIEPAATPSSTPEPQYPRTAVAPEPQ